MATIDGSYLVVLMLTGVTVVIITLRAMARAQRLKEQAWAEQATATPRHTATPRQSATPRRSAAARGSAVENAHVSG